MPHRLAYYLEQAALARRVAEETTSAHDRETWQRIAAEWQSLHDTLARDLGTTVVDLDETNKQ